MNQETPAELLQQLLDACNETNAGAMRLAEQTEIEDLRSFLQESARQYRHAADEIRTALPDADEVSPAQRRLVGRDRHEDDDVAAAWERTECQALTYFRDAYDAPLPSPVADLVKRHFEAGVFRLERFRKLQGR